jgi:two-component system sensor histidine kinase DesK
MVVEDDGTGARGSLPGSGLRGLSERVGDVGGSLSVHGDGPGFLLQAEVPLRGASYDEPLVGTRP